MQKNLRNIFFGPIQTQVPLDFKKETLWRLFSIDGQHVDYISLGII